jgi:hypothetical protein
MSASEPASESHFESDDRRTSQQEQPRELRNGKEPRGGISEAEWTIAIEEKSNVSIFRVPNILVPDTEKREAYVPKRVSLGPYHHRSAELSPMDSHKKRALQRMIARFNNVKNLANDPNNMDFFLEAREEIVKLQKKIRDSYEEEINWDEKTALMLSLDGCFILEILRTLSGDILPGASNYYEPLFEKNKIRYTGMDILNDILKLENQIPLMVLLKLLKMELNSTDIDVEKKLLKVLRSSFLSFFYPFDYKKEMKQWSWSQHDQEVHHLLGLLHRFIVCPQSHNGERAGHNYRRLPDQDEDSALNGGDEDSAMSEVACNIHRAVELGNAGIKFKRGDGGIENIKFDQSSATIYLPPITIDDSTEILFRNLIAFEMCKPSEFNYVACYVCLMDQLIDSEADVALLRRKGIVTNRLGSDGEVAKLFNSLCKGVTVSLEDVFDQLTEKVNVHYNNEFKVHCAELVKEHFSSPWKILGLAAAIILLLLTTVQTIFAILTLYK